MGTLRKQTVLRVIIVLLVIACFVLGLLAIRRFVTIRAAEEALERETDPSLIDPYEDDDGVARVFYNGSWYMANPDVESVLLLGIDSYGEQEDNGRLVNNTQADFLMLFVVDNARKEYTALQLNRDTMTLIPMVDTNGEYSGTVVEQLALAHIIGSGREDSCKYTAMAVSWLLSGVPIDHYVSLSMDAIGIMNDQVGGVTVTIPADMTSYDESWTEGAAVKLTADQAETFVRKRKDVSDQTNLSRMERQRIFLSAWRELALNKARSSGSFALDAVLSIADYMVSDMTANELSDFANSLTAYQDQGILTTEGENRLGDTYYEFYVDEDALQQTVMDLFYEKDTEMQ